MGFFHSIYMCFDMILNKLSFSTVMRTSWADAVGNAASDSPMASSADNMSRTTRSTYVPPHLRNKQQASETSAAPHLSTVAGNDRFNQSKSIVAYDRANNRVPASGTQNGGASRPDSVRHGYGGSWNDRSSGWDYGRQQEVNPFDDAGDAEQELSEQENTGIN